MQYIIFKEEENILNHYKCIYFVHQLKITVYKKKIIPAIMGEFALIASTLGHF